MVRRHLGRYHDGWLQCGEATCAHRTRNLVCSLLRSDADVLFLSPFPTLYLSKSIACSCSGTSSSSSSSSEMAWRDGTGETAQGRWRSQRVRPRPWRSRGACCAPMPGCSTHWWTAHWTAHVLWPHPRARPSLARCCPIRVLRPRLRPPLPCASTARPWARGTVRPCSIGTPRLAHASHAVLRLRPRPPLPCASTISFTSNLPSIFFFCVCITCVRVEYNVCVCTCVYTVCVCVCCGQAREVGVFCLVAVCVCVCVRESITCVYVCKV